MSQKQAKKSAPNTFLAKTHRLFQQPAKSLILFARLFGLFCPHAKPGKM